MNTVNGFRHQRLSRGLTMQQVSDLSGVSAYIIRCCEEGNVENIALKRLLALSSALASPFRRACVSGRRRASGSVPAAGSRATFWRTTWPTGS